MVDPPTLGLLPGYWLSAVWFGPGWIFVHFSNAADPEAAAKLECWVPPRIESDGTSISDGEHGYADSLRALLGQTVQMAQDCTPDGLRIVLDKATIVFRPSLSEMESAGVPEIAVLFVNEVWDYWRPGERSFEYLG